MEVKNELLNAYPNTCHYKNVNDIYSGFKGLEQFGLIYELIECMNSDNLKVRLIHADSGVQEYQIHYKIGSYTFLLTDWRWQIGNNVFESFDEFCELLQSEIDKMPKLKVTESLIWEDENGIKSSW